jgi:hypothetical protein
MEMRRVDWTSGFFWVSNSLVLVGQFYVLHKKSMPKFVFFEHCSLSLVQDLWA